MSDRPERVYLAVVLPFGLVFAFLIPPFQVADESRHFLRAYQVAQGGLVSDLQKGTTGGWMPAEVGEVAHAYEELQWHSERKIEPARIVADLRRPHSQERVFTEVVAASYSPVAYLPQVVAIEIGRLLGAPVLVCLYLARIAALCMVVAALWWALRITPMLRAGLLLLALMPMFVSEAAAVSADPCLNSASVVLVASIFEVAFGTACISLRRLAGWAVLAVLITLCKPIYLVLLAFVFVIPAQKWSRARQAGGFLLLSLPSLVAARAWSLLSNAHGFAPSSPGGQSSLAMALGAPWDLVRLVANTYRSFAAFLLQSFAGNLGWLDTPLPWATVVILEVALVAAALVDQRSRAVSLWHRMVGGAIFLAGMAGIAAAMFLYNPTDDKSVISGIQGRYFIPLAPAALLALAGLGARLRLDERWAIRGAAVVAVGALASAVAAVVLRYYGYFWR